MRQISKMETRGTTARWGSTNLVGRRVVDAGERSHAEFDDVVVVHQVTRRRRDTEETLMRQVRQSGGVTPIVQRL